MFILSDNSKVMIKKLPKFTRNFYFISGMLFFCWMLFLDSNDLYTQYKLSRQLKTLENEKEFYEQKIEEVKKEREQLLTDSETLEKFAREKYLMKKESEDLYVIVEE
jgi:cell division protein FtsB